ncbi:MULTISPECIES: hypothetical protein [unclassified Streptomyces]|uniref:hypothetical protein n=1 Tax=unclassified Streptomyces TaxID=2593676 RepID=UPI00278BC295|nr:MULTISPECIES: hypothetical protein [unclassified Streptomyces]
MADFTTETVTRTIRRWIVPAAEIGKAWSVAERAYRQQHQIPDEQGLHDNALRFHTRDDQIVIEFTVEEPK